MVAMHGSVGRHVKLLHQNGAIQAVLHTQGKCYSKKSNDNFFSRASSFLQAEESLDKEYTERRLMGYSMEQMFDVVLDVAAYQKFLPWCQKSVVLRQNKDNMVAEMTIGINPLTEKYTSVVTYSRPLYIVAESKQGRLFNHLANNWKFSPGLKSHPNSCVVDFCVSFKFKSMLQARLGNVFFDETAKVMTAAFYKEAQRRYGKESLPSMKVEIITKNEKIS